MIILNTLLEFSYETYLPLEIWKKYLLLSNQLNKATKCYKLRHFTLTEWLVG